MFIVLISKTQLEMGFIFRRRCWIGHKPEAREVEIEDFDGERKREGERDRKKYKDEEVSRSFWKLEEEAQICLCEQ